MSSTQRLERLLRLVNLLQSGRQFNTRELSEILGVSRRTIFRDINLLQDCGVQIQFSEERQGYSLPGSIYVQPLDFALNEVLFLLILCGDIPENSSHYPFPEAAQSAYLKILSSLPQSMRESVGELTEQVQFRLDSHTPQEPGREHYENCLRSLRDHKQLRIRYYSLTDWEEIGLVISPYRLVFLRRSWYVIARSSVHREVRTFKVSRIRHSELLDQSYDIPRNFNLDRYLGNAWHLIRDADGKSWTVKIRFQKQVAQNVAEVSWHKTQKLDWQEDGSLLFEVVVDSLKEIVWWVLGYGAQAEVLEPIELRDEVISHVQEMLGVYDDQ
ncbi:transcriptional regulator [Planctomycetaceae bacterium]|jgi:predicted DNA-binding transcriptional regulator YafY|nr:transcriptional regulator [Planctomycetaceae bacterium]MDC0307990.1 transcriptional regulator [Planctomycetaceae bacterium]MDG2389052.1 transcriptional regulator [Planctomycetaceae bacterium]